MATASMSAPVGAPYPVQFSVDYPEGERNRLTTAFRIILAIPIFIVVAALSNASISLDTSDAQTAAATAGGVLFLPVLLMIVFRQKYPRWWFDWNLELMRLSNRAIAYLALLRDEYPSTDEQQAVHLDMQYPNAATQLNRWLPLVKWLLAIPHYIVLVFLTFGAIVAVVVAWFAILITGRYPRSLFDFVVGVLRWGVRVEAYAIALVTDEYPPFSLDA